ncbi:uncharacterized protein LOC129228407 [Uloborus diversus]|uniref:uncharacterized protein LOC129228407 n=1 Tax=Uloborus diversus TaxID=327109 RepID=UPI0024095F7E|nr:uncharacterized protein LOC129228407 [Uloborus diversus]
MEWLSEIDEIENIKIPRLYFTDFEWGASEVHIFSDASPKCYGCVAYFRMKHGDGYLTKFMIAKSRVAPLKGLTLPRLELMGALISSRLGSYLQDTFRKLEKQKIFYWTDSQICLHWIKGNADEWKQFVRNRVKEIQTKTNPSNWFFCNGKDNPSDKLTRGIRVQALVNDKVWFYGPAWLNELDMSCNMESANVDIDVHCAEERKRSVVTLQTNIESSQPLLNLENYSDLNKVLRITSYVMRFIKNCRATNEMKTGSITANEMTDAERYWIRTVQQSEFEKEYSQLKNKEPISPSSKLYSFNPILTSDDLIAVRVLIGEEKTPRQLWKLGRVIEVHKVRDKKRVPET